MLRSIVMAAILASCASAAQVTPQVRLPESAELEVYVRQHWEVFSHRVATFAGRTGESPSMEGFRDADCDHFLSDVIACSFYVTARFEDGQARDQWLSTHFLRDEAGKLKEVWVSVHERPS